ncbi:hypothetical protein G647_05465 [Cladophialophora carrionii CBS 160.54]|uniref:DNA (cytosine-5-)-methyltransferase n=1 Tax=Cladophialophora carrionii CBS 160.54 TaxID=1279043 RepID=V9DBI6_9EURO|nr:uncharacterized protein G647_05465 [Cladophialophora carrionii CBS 160.54]ETI23663.1 hypothetical protein G647_05465 [Cladophialophora carrionii CBS 160.54]
MDWFTDPVASRGAGDLSSLQSQQLAGDQVLRHNQRQTAQSESQKLCSDPYRNDEKLAISTTVNDNDDELITLDEANDVNDLMVIKVQPVPKPTVVVDARDPTSNGALVLKPGCGVELEDHSFLTITETITSSSSTRYIRGHRLLLQNHCELLMPERHHELVQLVNIDKELNTEVALWTVPIDAAVRNCKIIYTNQQYEELNYQKDIQPGSSDEDDKHIYFCRYTSGHTNVGIDGHKPSGPPKTGRIEHLRSHQADGGTLITRGGQHIQLRIPDAQVRKQWRGEVDCVLGGSHVEQYDGMEMKRYTFGDAFAGAGGTSWGARAAGLKMKFAFDLDPWAVQTYQQNFGLTGMQILQMDVHDFVKKAALAGSDMAKTCLVDILHMSPPCQPFCGANRRPNLADNERNLGAFGRVADLLDVCKPRIATLEESKSITDVDKRKHFTELIGFFIQKGYSVQWKVLDLECWGVPQTRKRVILIASGPGEKLPTLLKPTHGRGPGLEKLPGIGTAIRNIPDNALHHDEIPRMEGPKPGYDDDRLCPTIMTKAKAKHYHPDGHRRFSVREHAALQTFPHFFVFCGPTVEKMKQVGNAVPPVFSEKMFRDLTQQLLAFDLAELAELSRAANGSKDW